MCVQSSQLYSLSTSQATYRALIHKLCTFRRFDTVQQLLDKMPSSIVSPPDEDGFITIICGLGRVRMMKQVIKVAELVCQGCTGSGISQEHSREPSILEGEVLNKLLQFELSAKEDGGVDIAQNDISVSQEECHRSLIGRICGDKVANITGLRNTMSSVWKLSGDLKIREIGQNMFQFIFQCKDDSLKVLSGRSWTFDGHYLLMKEWSEEAEKHPEILRWIQIWVQVWDLPSNWISKAVGLKLGKLFTWAKDVIIPEYGSRKGRHLKMLVEVDVQKPLLRGTKIRLDNQQGGYFLNTNSSRTFCFYCGKLGHGERLCSSRSKDLKQNRLQEGQFGDWLQADIPRKLVGRSAKEDMSGFIQKLKTQIPQSEEIIPDAVNKEDGERHQALPTVPSLQASLTICAVIAENQQHDCQTIRFEQQEGKPLPKVQSQQLDKVDKQSENDVPAPPSILSITRQKTVQHLPTQQSSESEVLPADIQHQQIGEDQLDAFSKMPMELDGHLVNVSLQEEVQRHPLQPLPLQDSQSTIAGILSARKGSKTWRRFTGKENISQVQKLQGSGQQASTGDTQASHSYRKRGWTLRDEPDEELDSAIYTKKLKSHNETQDITLIEVEVARPEWPQSFQ